LRGQLLKQRRRSVKCVPLKNAQMAYPGDPFASPAVLMNEMNVSKVLLEVHFSPDPHLKRYFHFCKRLIKSMFISGYFNKFSIIKHSNVNSATLSFPETYV
jgi:hypothetical protein